MRLIYAEEFKEKILAVRDAIPRTVPLEQYEFGSKPYRDGDLMRGGIRKALRCLEETPTIDAEPVVRCKDCVRSTVHLDHLYCEGLFACVQKDWYCASGKRKDDP